MFRGSMGCSRGVLGLFRAVSGCSGGVPGKLRGVPGCSRVACSRLRGETGGNISPSLLSFFSRSFARFIFRSRSTIWTPGTSYNQCHFVETLSVQLCLPLSPTRQCWKNVSTTLMKTSAHNTMQHWIGEGGEGVSTICVTGCKWFKRIIYLWN